MASRYGSVRHRSTQHTSTQTQRNGEPSRETLAAFACGRYEHVKIVGSPILVSSLQQLSSSFDGTDNMIGALWLAGIDRLSRCCRIDGYFKGRGSS